MCSSNKFENKSIERERETRRRVKLGIEWGRIVTLIPLEAAENLPLKLCFLHVYEMAKRIGEREREEMKIIAAKQAGRQAQAILYCLLKAHQSTNSSFNSQHNTLLLTLHHRWCALAKERCLECPKKKENFPRRPREHEKRDCRNELLIIQNLGSID